MGFALSYLPALLDPLFQMIQQKPNIILDVLFCPLTQYAGKMGLIEVEEDQK